MYILEQETNSKTATYKNTNQSKDFYMQTSLLYRNSDGILMMRIHNFFTPVSASLTDVCSSVNYQVLGAAILRRTICQLASLRPVYDIQADLIGQFKQIFKLMSLYTIA